VVKGKDNHSKKSRNGGNGGDNHSIRGDKRINKSSDSVTTLKEKHREKTRVAVISIIASAALAFSKFIVAMVTGSLAILSEALHSG
jgi:Co/Zn/Cd efflux system component